MNEYQADQIITEARHMNSHLISIGQTEIDLTLIASGVADISNSLSGIAAVASQLATLQVSLDGLSDNMHDMVEELKHKETLFLVTKDNEDKP